MQRVEAYIEANKQEFDVDTYYSFWVSDQASTRLYLKPKEEATVPAAEVMKRVMADMPEIIIGKPSFQFDQGAGGASAFTLQLSGESTERLATISQEVARRLSTVVNADQIVVLDAGRVAEQGTHAELLAKNGLYAEMWARQQAEKEEEAVAAE